MSPDSTKAQPEAVALFASDVHLQAAMPATTDAFLSFLEKQAMHSQRLYLLGDLFEYWAGDDDIDDPFHRRVIDALRAVSNAGTAIFWIGGNRDFLVGEKFAAASGMTLLADGSVVQIAGNTVVLAHGDAQCTDDIGYIAFRTQVRQPEWQAAFLARPLAERKAIIQGMREGSRAAQRDKSMDIMDVNAAAIDALFGLSGTSLMIHGHTHRPAVHRTGGDAQPRVRYVLPDWDCDANPPRGGWLEITAQGSVLRYGPRGEPL